MSIIRRKASAALQYGFLAGMMALFLGLVVSILGEMAWAVVNWAIRKSWSATEVTVTAFTTLGLALGIIYGLTEGWQDET